MIMSETALLFSGQGSQYAGMGKDLVENYSTAKKIFTLANEILGFDLREKIDSGQLENTLLAQPAIFAVSVAALACAKEKGIEFSAVAGHSLGEYAALVACGAVSLEDGFRLIKIRSEIMHEAATGSTGGMAAVIGGDSKLIEEVCREINAAGDYITPANFNSPSQTVVAGTITALVKAEVIFPKRGAKRFMLLNVAAAFHSELMKSAAEKFKSLINNISFREPDVPFYSNLTGGRLSDFSDMPDYLSRHICSPVRFTDELYAMKNDGYGTFLELGPGKTLVGLVKKTLPDTKTCNIGDMLDFSGN